jgi:uncharacterized membrane protein
VQPRLRSFAFFILVALASYTASLWADVVMWNGFLLVYLGFQANWLFFGGIMWNFMELNGISWQLSGLQWDSMRSKTSQYMSVYR